MSKSFEMLVQEWKAAAIDATAKKLEYEHAWAMAFLASDQKTEAGRKADADVKAQLARAVSESAAIEAAALLHLVMHARGDVAAFRAAA